MLMSESIGREKMSSCSWWLGFEVVECGFVMALVRFFAGRYKSNVVRIYLPVPLRAARKRAIVFDEVQQKKTRSLENILGCSISLSKLLIAEFAKSLWAFVTFLSLRIRVLRQETQLPLQKGAILK